MSARPMDNAESTGLDDYRVSAPAEISAILKRFAEHNVHVSVNAPNGTSITATVWQVDAKRGLVSLSVLADEPQLDAIVECDEAMVIGYLDSIKIQFDMDDLVLVHSAKDRALNGTFPKEIYRFQRRNGFRVQPMQRSTPVAKFRHPMIPDMQLALRVLDVSIGGCALFLPHDVPALDPGVLMNGVVMELDGDTRVSTGLRLQHVTSINPDANGVRLGCEFVSPSNDGLRALQLYIDQTQKRRRQLAMG